jgi:hypothetical protein
MMVNDRQFPALVASLMRIGKRFVRPRLKKVHP